MHTKVRILSDLILSLLFSGHALCADKVLNQLYATDQTCSVTNGSGTLQGENVETVGVICRLTSGEIFKDGFESL